MRTPKPAVQLARCAGGSRGRAGVRARRRRLRDVAERDRDDHPVQRLARPGALQQVEERVPAGPVHRRIGILGGVAAGGVDQHGVLGEPPLAQPGAADARHRALAHLGGQRELQPGVQQRGGLAGAGRPDDGVPGLLVQVAARAAAPASAAPARWRACRGAPRLRAAARRPAGDAGRQRASRAGGGAGRAAGWRPPRPQHRQRRAPAGAAQSSSCGSSGPNTQTQAGQQQHAEQGPSTSARAGRARGKDVTGPAIPGGCSTISIRRFCSRPSGGGVGRDRIGIGPALGAQTRRVAGGAPERLAHRLRRGADGQLEIGRELQRADRLVVGVADHLHGRRRAPAARRRGRRRPASAAAGRPAAGWRCRPETSRRCRAAGRWWRRCRRWSTCSGRYRS